MGDYRHFPDQPVHVRARDPYGQDRADPRAPSVAPRDGRGYAPPRPAQGHASPHDPYAHDPYAQDDYAPEGYAPQNYAPQNYAPQDHTPPPYGHDRYAPPLRAAQPMVRGPVAGHAAVVPPYQTQPPVRAPYAPDAPFAPQSAYGMQSDPMAPPPAWVGPQAVRGAAQGHAAPAATAQLRPAALMHALGAVLSLGLVVLAGAWTWNMMQRDVSGVPVVRALEGPMRVAPETPGGQQAAFQGLAINELAGAGSSSESDAIVLAPPPVGLGDLTAPQTVAFGVSEVDDTEAPVPDGPALGINNPNRLAVTRSPRPRGRDDAGVQVASVAPIAAPQMPALSTSNDPRAADSLAASIAQSVALDMSAPRGVDVDPASIGPGTRLVQLGAYDNADEARGAWDGLSRRFSPLLNDRGRVIEAAHSGGSVFYRLRAHGFTDERDARRFCAALVAEQIDCIPVLVR